MTNDRIIVALDVDSAEEARALVTRLGAQIRFYKVGMELYAAAGMDFVNELRDQGNDVFLDMKYYDIGETVKRAVRVRGEKRSTLPDRAWQQPGDARGA